MEQVSDILIIGKSYESRPNPRFLKQGTRLYETDTGNWYTWANGDWKIDGSSAYVKATYNVLKKLKEKELLVPGKQYLLTDYQCKYLIPYTQSSDLSSLGVGSSDVVTDTSGKIVAKPEGVINTEVHDGEAYGDLMSSSDNPETSTENIIITASSTFSFSKKALSFDYPGEELVYDFEANSFTDYQGNIHNRTGWIEKRVKESEGINLKIEGIKDSKGGDYRHIRFRRWHTNIDFTQATTGMPDLYLGENSLTVEKQTFLPCPEFDCGVNITEFTNSEHEVVGVNTFTASSSLNFYDYYSFDYESYNSIYELTGVLNNTVLKRSSGDYIKKLNINEVTNCTVEVYNARSTYIGLAKNWVHLWNMNWTDAERGSSLTSCKISDIINSFTVNGLHGFYSAFIENSTITGELTSITSGKYIHSSCITMCGGSLYNIVWSYINAGNEIYGRYTNTSPVNIEYSRRSTVYTNGTRNENIDIKEIETFNLFFTGSRFYLKAGSGGKIGDWGNFVSLDNSSIETLIQGDFTSNLENKSVNKKSPDGSVWYDDIDDSGNVTPTKFT